MINMSKNPKIKILKSYKHPITDVLIIHFETDYGFKTNVNIPPSMLEGQTPAQMEQTIDNIIDGIYEDKKRQKKQ